MIGAAIDLRNCLDLTIRDNLELVKAAYVSFRSVREAAHLPMPKNMKAPKNPSPDRVLRYLDCAVMNHLHTIVDELAPEHVEKFDSVRGMFGEGIPLYDGSDFRDKTHIQIAVRNPDCILGVFVPRGAYASPL